MRYILGTLICLAVLSGQEVAVPTRGAAATGKPTTLRPVIGIPGAAVLGDAVAQGAFTLSPGQAWAAVDSEGALEIVLMSGDRSKIAGVPAGPLRAFSPQGGRLAVYDGSTVTIVGGLPEAPAVSKRLPSAPASLISLSVSEDGQVVLGVDAAGVAYRWTGDTWAAIGGANAISAVQILGASHRAVLVSGSLGNALLLETDGTLAQLASLHAIERPMLAGSTDGQLVVAVADKGTELAILQIDSGNVQYVPLDAPALTVVAGQGSEFAIGGEAATGAWLLDSARRLSYIPTATRN